LISAQGPQFAGGVVGEIPAGLENIVAWIDQMVTMKFNQIKLQELLNIT
jgi:hypothetical protein